MTIETLHKEIERRWDKHLSETRRVLKVPSVSMTGEGIEKSAGIVEDLLGRLGAKTRQFRGSKTSHPLVYGNLDVGADQTVIVYGMYDVQPVGDPKEWDHPPFGATIVKKKPYGEILVNRGVVNSKASLVGSILAIETMLDKAELPANVHFLIEGEEELGGLSLPKFVFKNKKTLSKADATFWFDYCENAEGVPGLGLGFKGCVYFDLIAEGTPQGGPLEGELHSSDAVWVQSPVWRLLRAVSTFVDDNERPAIDGIWDNVVGPSKDDKALIKELAKDFKQENYLKEIGVKKFKAEGTNNEMLTKYLFEPSVNIAGFLAGYTEEGTKTVLPPKAMLKMDIRLVPNMTIEETRKKVKEHLKRRGFTDIKMRNYIDYPWSKVSQHEPVSKAVIEAMRYHGKEPEVWPMSAASAPMYLFDQVLRVPYGGCGLGHGGKAHAPNEFAVVKGMLDFEKSVVTVFHKFAEFSSK